MTFSDDELKMMERILEFYEIGDPIKDVIDGSALEDLAVRAFEHVLRPDEHPAVAAIKFVLGNCSAGDMGQFLQAWVHGDYECIKEEWPEAPDCLKGN
jgi:hypothetical protein